ncbi:histidine kinase [Streptomyces cinereoruber]|uniref:histidine kinase n=1 Tax=Streptomyces cinereoruber TaxID=67260 RepID=A0AAV4KPQ9_9ACTN|nr:SpoIIE family protein phosphatase [Streptomyces cinereoruber]MBB4161027.1 PAS domain S-box-containing protein [Streptomyces cinereoruber]NIH62493.1 PAS domain S-box-containing protein [Streptomyces cinereoruber]QEV35267.1 response regulator [Streptomyces cinereoruber]GGR42606.1 histidine kinase [Streptomyces cinereoruber]
MTRSEDGGPATPSTAVTGVFGADKGIGEDLARVDWSATPLGPPQDWPQSLRTAVSILLSSKFAMWMAWGPELTFFCNDAYRRDTLGQKYPWALGRPSSEVWSEIWSDIGPRIDTVLTSGEATWDEALLLFLERSGYPEESYHTFSYSPLRDDDGAVVGMLCVVSEDTERVIGERRMATLRDLGSDPSVIRTEPQMFDFVAGQLGRNPYDLPFTLTYLFQEDGSARLSSLTGVPDGHPMAPETLPADSTSVWPTDAPTRGESLLVPLDGEPFRDLPSGGWEEVPTQALVVPLHQQGAAPYGFMVAGLNRYRALDEGHRGFLELVAGHVATGVSSARSYQAQQRRAEELAELDRAKTTFFSNISHEFRTPLTLIMGPLQELQQQLADAEPRVREELSAIHRNGLRLGKLVNTLLDFSRIEAGRMRASYEPVDLAAITGELASVFRSAVDKAGLDFQVDCAPLPEPVYVDRGMWEKVVLNLLSNALKFTFDGMIRVGVRAEDGEAVVTVADTGIGVAAEEMPRLFERFHRIENARSRSGEGSGIGLALVKELVGLHGGTIAAVSTEGEGTRFTIRLPFGSAHLPAHAVRPEMGTTAPSAADPFVQEALRWLPGERTEEATDAFDAAPDTGDDARLPRPAAPARVLIADDNADMREYLTRLLRGAGHSVHAVEDGRQALDAVRAEAPDVVVSDVMMPRLNGLDLVRALRADPRTASVPVLLLSARAGQEASIEGLRAGADDYLVKPFAAAELLARVEANVKLARLRNHHARWRTALIDSLQEAFFVCDEDGAVIEINASFTTILGYGPEGLPYRPVHPWWPDAAVQPEAHRQVAEAFATLTGQERGSYTIPVTHRDGHRLWVTATFNQVQDPDTDRTVIVGTFRDVTTEHYAVQRETALAALGARLSQATSLSDATAGALEELKEVWRARNVAAAVFGHGDEPVLTSTDPSLTWRELPAEHRDALAGLCRQPELTPVTDPGGAAVLLEHPDGPLALRIDLEEQRPFTGEDQLLLSLLAGRLAQGLARAHQIDQQRETAIALQRAILGPSHLPEGFAVRYEPATRPLEVGGDWYDTVTLPDGRIGIVVGDCVGRGLEAASVMGQLRSACRALLLQDAGPAQALMALDRFAAGVPGAMCTTVFCGVLDPGTGALTYSSAGHPPGILVLADGTTRLLEDGRSLPLAVRPGAPRPEGRCAISARSTLLLYTDGLVERRRRPLSAGIDQAGKALQDGRDTAIDELATDVMSRLAPADGYDDDVALLLYRHPAPLEMSFPAESGQLAPVRKALRGWLDQCDLPPGTVQNILVAAGEACANAIEHGHRDAPGDTVYFRAEASVDNLHLTVTDTGRWKVPQPERNAHRGRGMALMRALMQQVTVTQGPTGTTVAMHTRIA